MSFLFGGGGGGSGGTKGVNPTQGVDIPAFTSQGGITPEQQGLADFTYGQNLMGEAALYAGEGLGQSTMATQGAEGAATGRAQQEAQMSDINTGARYGQYQNEVTNLEETLKNQSTLDQIAQNANSQNLSGLFTGLGNLFGTGKQGQFGTGTT